MSNKKQSSVEWFKQSSVEWLFVGLWNTPKDKFEWHKILRKAIAMHKEEIEDAYDAVIIDENGGLLDGKEYYKETFGGNNE